MITDNDRLKRELNDKVARIEAQNERISELIAKNERLVDDKNNMVERRNDVRGRHARADVAPPPSSPF